MAFPSHITNVIDVLLDRTITRKISWTTTSRATEFKYSFSKGAVTVDCWTIQNEGPAADIVIYNDEGAQVERFTATEPEENFEDLVRLHSAIVKSITKADETYKGLFDDLNNL